MKGTYVLPFTLFMEIYRNHKQLITKFNVYFLEI